MTDKAVAIVEEQEAAPELDTQEGTRTESKKQPPFAVILHNDDYNTFPFVTQVLSKVFRYEWWKAFSMTVKIHIAGRGIVWSGLLEVAELKAEQMRSFGPDPDGRKGVLPLNVSVEPLP
jgi:ATP-dependent Clp protease adaptor protein ClpS